MTNGETILSEMNSFIPENSSADDELPFESLEEFSTDPVGFEEVAAMVQTKVQHFFSLSARYNRLSPKYLEVCGFLERGIKYLGSVAVTREFMKTKGYQFPQIEELTTHWLFGIVSFNLRKLNKAVETLLCQSEDLPRKWLDMMFRYVTLTERLRASEEKIYNCCEYTWEDGYKYLRRALMYSKESSNCYYVKKNIPKPIFRMASAYPVMKETLREVCLSENEEQLSIPEETAEAPQLPAVTEAPGDDPESRDAAETEGIGQPAGTDADEAFDESEQERDRIREADYLKEKLLYQSLLNLENARPFAPPKAFSPGVFDDEDEDDDDFY